MKGWLRVSTPIAEESMADEVRWGEGLESPQPQANGTAAAAAALVPLQALLPLSAACDTENYSPEVSASRSR
jgi:hypothetical protein